MLCGKMKDGRMKKKIIIAVIIAICVIAAGIIILALSSNDKTKNSVSESDKITQEQQQVIEKEKKEESAQKATEKTDKNRAGKYSEELFRLSLIYTDEYNIDTDDFSIVKAMVVQDIDNDYFYFQCRHSGKTEYACYSYDDHDFREVSQKKLKKEYEDALAIKEYGDVDYEVYYELTEDEIKEVNEMF